MKIKTYSMKQLKKIMPRQKIKQFLCQPMVYKDTKQPIICQIKGCKESVSWAVGDKNGNCITLCFGHGEET